MSSTISKTAEKIAYLSKYDECWNVPKCDTGRMFVPTLKETMAYLENKGFTITSKFMCGGKISGPSATYYYIFKDGVQVYKVSAGGYRTAIAFALFAAKA